jgi:hypothetical protein
MKILSLFVASMLLISSSSFAGSYSHHEQNSQKIAQAFETLKDIGVDLQPTGAICEYIAKAQLEKKYSPEQFQIILGVQYGEERNAVGELDVTIVDLEYQEVIYVAEVKCWKKPRAGLKKAKSQISRFMNYLRGHRVNWMKILAPDYEGTTIDSSYYQNDFEVGYIAQKGSRKSGYTTELEFTLREAMELRSMIMTCQREGDCRSFKN